MTPCRARADNAARNHLADQGEVALALSRRNPSYSNVHSVISSSPLVSFPALSAGEIALLVNQALTRPSARPALELRN
jgi:hypothetical protein